MEAWKVVEPMLTKAVDRSNGRMTISELVHDIFTSDQTLWVALDGNEIIGCCTVRIVRYPTDLMTLSYEYLAGEDVGRWLEEGHKVLTEYAKELGCSRLEVPQGRKGWEPFLKKLGYRTHAVRYECEIED